MTKLDFYFEGHDIKNKIFVPEFLSQLNSETVIKKYLEYLTSKGMNRYVILRAVFSRKGWNEDTLSKLVM